MQNYLQKNKTAIMIKKLLVLSASVLVTAMIISACFNKYSLMADGGRVNEPYAESLFETLPKKADKTGGDDAVNDAEMNNFESENSKIEQKDDLTAKKGLKCSENVRVLQKDGSVEIMELEDYVEGCVLGEMPLSFESQAVMAQSVAVRTFTVRQINGKSKHKNADVCTNSACCQSYINPMSLKISKENLKKLKDAVNATKGMVIVYEGQPIEAVYHASSGKATLNSEDVWGGKVDYLRSVPSPEGEAALTSVAYGHRVGMSQHGANLLAKQGLNYCQILKYYYNGVFFDFLV